MRKPLYQQLIDATGWMLVSIQALAGFIGLFGDTSAWLSIKTVSIFTLISVAIYLALTILFRYRRIRWVTDTNQVIHIVKFGKKLIWSFLGGLVLLWSSAIYNETKAVKIKSPIAAQKTINPVFSPSDKRIKILILPWEKECQYEGKTYEIGRILQKRIEQLGIEENIPFYTHYLNDTIDFRNFRHGMADSLMKSNYADHVLYGAYSFKECEGDSSDKFCFNYQTNTTNFYTLNIKAKTQYKMESFAGLEDIRQGNGKEGIDHIAYWIAGVAGIKQKKFTEAIRMLKKIKGYENNENVLFLMGICYYLLKDNTNAMICNQKVLKINPANAEAAIHLGVTYFTTGKVEEAKEYFEKVLKYCPDNIEALRNLGRIYNIKHDSLTARVYLGRIITLIPPDSEVHLVILASALSDYGNYQLAKYYFERALRIQPGNMDNWLALAEINKHLNDTAYAMVCYKKVLEIEPQEPMVHFKIAQLYQQNKDYNNAQLYFQKTIQLNPSYVEAWSSLGMTYFISGSNAKAMECLEKAVIIDPKNIIALYTAFCFYKKIKNYDKCRQFMETIVKYYSENGAMWNELGIVYKELDHYKKALLCFNRTLNLLPENAMAYYNIASTYSSMHNKPNALQYLSKAVSGDIEVKNIIDTDSSFFWLQGNKELCAIIQ